jgi:preprotein translocase subunit SecE
MGETENKNSASKENWFTGVKAEFNKIIWPTKESLARQTTAVVVVSVIVGLIIAVLDYGIQELVNILVNL